MFVNPDRFVLFAAGGFVAILVLAALGVWMRDRRLGRQARREESIAVPLPIPERALSPRHASSGESLPVVISEAGRIPQDAAPPILSPLPTVERDAPGRASQRTRVNFTEHGSSHGPIVEALARALASLALALPEHAFTLEAAPGLDGLCVEEPGFSLAFCSLLLHAAQEARSHAISIRPMTPQDPLYPLDLRSSVILEICTPPSRSPMSACLAELALEACHQASGAGSIVDQTKLWLVWPARTPGIAAVDSLRSTVYSASAHA
jgi:hypothetical protein